VRLLSSDAHAGRSAVGIHLSITPPNKVAVWRSASLGPSGFTADCGLASNTRPSFFSLCCVPLAVVSIEASETPSFVAC